MKSLENVVSESLNEGYKEPKFPKVKTKAWDLGGTPWTIDVIDMIGSSYIEQTMDEYDDAGYADYMMNEYDPGTIVVGAHDPDGTKAVWLWDSSGICYENK